MTITDFIIGKTAAFVGRVVDIWSDKLADMFDRGIICKHRVMFDVDCMDCLEDRLDIEWIRRELEHVIAMQELNELEGLWRK